MGATFPVEVREQLTRPAVELSRNGTAFPTGQKQVFGCMENSAVETGLSTSQLRKVTLTDFEEMVDGYHISVHKTTIYLDLCDHRRITALAKAIGRPTAELIREPVADYLRRYAPGGEPSCLGAGRSAGQTWAKGQRSSWPVSENLSDRRRYRRNPGAG
ncbi:MAG: hypothetical protein Kow001_15440 [Acidobacteriota bacterium]